MNFEFKNDATRTNLQENKRMPKWRPFWDKVHSPWKGIRRFRIEGTDLFTPIRLYYISNKWMSTAS